MDPFSASARPFDSPDFSLESRKKGTDSSNSNKSKSHGSLGSFASFPNEPSSSSSSSSVFWQRQPYRGGVRSVSDNTAYKANKIKLKQPLLRTPAFDAQDALWQSVLGHAIDNSVGHIDLSKENITHIPLNLVDLRHLTHISTARTCSSRSLSFSHSQSSLHLLPSTPTKSHHPARPSVPTATTTPTTTESPSTVPIELFLNGNHLNQPDSFPLSFFLLDNLRVLAIRNNEIAHLSPLFGQLVGLKELSLGGNKLEYLPAELDNLQLDHLHLFPNPFLKPPQSNSASTSMSTSNVDNENGKKKKRILGPLVVFNTSRIPRLTEYCLRYLLSADNLAPESPVSSNSFSNSAANRMSRSISNSSLRFSTPSLGPRRRISNYILPGTTNSGSNENYNNQYLPDHLHAKLTSNDPLWLCPGCDEHYVSIGAQRLEWKSSIGGIDLGTELVPCLWTACSVECLLFLEEE